MSRRIVVIATIVVLASGPAWAGSPKRGWAGSDAADHNASNASWYYRWWHTIPGDAAGTNAEFIPLIKYPNSIQSKVDIVAGLSNVDTLLVLNEPERPDQSDTTVQEALAIWPTVQAGLPNHKLVSPGVSDNAAGQNWLLDFMGQVDARNANADPSDDLRVDAIAFHWYGASSPNAVNAANSFLNRVEWYHTTFGLPVWVTEFAMHDWEGNDPTEAMIAANAQFLEIVLPELEARSYVERYSYYNWFDDAMVFESPDRMPTVIGDQYVGTALPGDVDDLAGQSIGTDVGYLRGGEITNTGAAIPEAMRSIDALGGASKISGATDWSLSNRRDNYTRVRAGAALQKTGPNTIGLTGLLELDGDLQVQQGTLHLKGASPTGTGGGIYVGEDGTLLLDVGRNVFTVAGREFTNAGTVDGAIRFAGSAMVRPTGVSPVFTSNVTVQSSIVEVGGAGFNALTSSLEPVTAQLRLEYDAATDVSGDNVWDEAGGSADFLTFAGPASSVAVSDPSFPSVTAAYPIAQVGGANGLNQFFEAGAPRSREDATFEVVFHVDDLAAGGDQVLLEVGGSGRGVAFVLNDDTLTFNVDGDGSDINLNTVIATGWNHAVGVIDLAGGSDSIALYINGQSVGALFGQTINDWAGGNIAGLGAGYSSVTGVTAGVGAPFHGDLALARFYEGVAFSGAEALQNFAALTTAPVTEPTTMEVQGEFVVDATSELRLDIGDNAAADKIVVAGNMAVGGGALSVSYVGQDPLTLGDTFDLFDFGTATPDFAAATLPALPASLRWRLDRLAVDGVIEVVLAGDLNSDGAVNAADYTVWRDSLGASVTPYSSGDANGDGLVDQADYNEWLANFGAGAASFALAVPEPTAWCVLVFALAATRKERK